LISELTKRCLKLVSTEHNLETFLNADLLIFFYKNALWSNFLLNFSSEVMMAVGCLTKSIF